MSRPYHVLITGDRNWYCRDIARTILIAMQARHGELCIIHGDAAGVDSAFSRTAHEMDIAQYAYPAEWATLGRRAGPLRNQEMVDRGADVCLACHRDLASSKGTKDCVRRALKAGIPVFLVDGEDARPRRIFAADAPDQPDLFDNPAEARP